MLGDMLAEIARQVGRKARRSAAARAALSAGLGERGVVPPDRALRPFLTLDLLRMSRYRMFFSSAKAEAELGYSARPWQGAIGDDRMVPAGGHDPMTELILGGLSLAIWLGLIFAHHGFWLTRERDTLGMPAEPAVWPDVVAVVPARDEADVIARSIGSLVAQDYPGRFRVILVDDSSSDGTGDIARALGSDRLEVLTGAPLAKGWTGKLWAVSQGAARAGASPPISG
jgi:hypothetical protein